MRRRRKKDEKAKADQQTKPEAQGLESGVAGGGAQGVEATVEETTPTAQKGVGWDKEFNEAAEALDEIVAWLRERGFRDLDMLVPCCPQQISGRTPGGWLFYYRVRSGDGMLVADPAVKDLNELVERSFSETNPPAVSLTWVEDSKANGGWSTLLTATRKLASLVGF